MLIVHAARNGLPHSRLGISVSRRVGNAVHRNYWKRLIRQAFRCQCSLLPGGIDFVVRPQRSAIPEHSGINKSFLTLAKKLDRRLVTPRIER
jgi:ribonuclease P protein component